MSTPVADIAAGLSAGVLLGIVVFGSLWYTIDRIVVASGGLLVAWMLAGFVFRSALVLVVLLAVAPRGVPALVAVATGTTLVRLVITGVVRRGRTVGPWN
jgi:hypothetical protein